MSAVTFVDGSCEERLSGAKILAVRPQPFGNLVVTDRRCRGRRRWGW
jgi:hypothetical protein